MTIALMASRQRYEVSRRRDNQFFVTARVIHISQLKIDAVCQHRLVRGRLCSVKLPARPSTPKVLSTAVYCSAAL
jgi:hypothetical protein